MIVILARSIIAVTVAYYKTQNNVINNLILYISILRRICLKTYQ